MPHSLLYWTESVDPVPSLHKFREKGCTHDHWGAAENCDDFSDCACTRMNVCVRVCTRQRRCLSHFPTPCRIAPGPAHPGSPVRSHPAAVRGPNYRPGIIQSRPLASCQGLPSAASVWVLGVRTQRPALARRGLAQTSLGAVVARTRIAPSLTGLPDPVESFLDPKIPQDEGVLFKGDKGASGQFGILGFGI